MLEFLKPKKAVSEGEVKMPTFAELKAALPENLQDEFQQLGDRIKEIASLKGGAMDGREVAEEDMSPEEIAEFARYDELTKIARDSIEKKEK